MTLTVLLPSQARPLLARQMHMAPHQAEAVARSAVVVAVKSAAPPPAAGAHLPAGGLLSAQLVRLLTLGGALPAPEAGS